MSVNWILLLGVVSYTFYIAAYAVSSAILLRVLVSVGLITEAIYLAFPEPGEPPWLGIICNIIIFLTNIYYVGVYLKDHLGMKLTDSELRLYNYSFKNQFTKLDFGRLLRVAKRHNVSTGTILMQSGVSAEAILLIEDGDVSVSVGGREIARLSQGSLIGEMGYITKSPASADATATAATCYLSFSQADLKKIFSKYPSVEVSLNNYIGHDMVKKLREHGSLLQK